MLALVQMLPTKVPETRHFEEIIQVARMRVPKMVKNGFNSGLPVSPVFEEDKILKEINSRCEA
jgi:hypothetical protein